MLFFILKELLNDTEGETKMKKKLLAVIFLLTFALLLGGTKAIKSETSSETKLKDTLVIAQKAEIKTLDPQKSTDSVSNKIIQLMFDRP